MEYYLNASKILSIAYCQKYLLKTVHNNVLNTTTCHIMFLLHTHTHKHTRIHMIFS